MWSFLVGLFSGPLGAIAKELKEAYLAKQDAKTEQERIAAEERISTLEARKAVILAAQSDPVERWVRIGFAFPFVVYLWKLILWDKVLEWGVTDPLSPELSNIWMIVLAGYFVDVVVRRFKT